MPEQRYYQCRRDEVASLIPSEYSKVLEIGCAAGEFRSNLKLDHEYWGIEPTESVAQEAKKNLDHVLVGLYEEVHTELPDNYYDLIICNDVIEHMPDHDAFFQAIKQKLTNEGAIVASVPNVRHISNLINLIFKKDWKYTEDGILDKTHLRFFTKKSLIRTIQENGFHLDAISGLNRYKFWRSPIKLIKGLLILILGPDIQYVQYGIRITKKEK